MHWKKYLVLLPPFVFVFLMMIFELPEGKRYYAMFVLILFWVSYYGWAFLDNRKQQTQRNQKR